MATNFDQLKTIVDSKDYYRIADVLNESIELKPCPFCGSKAYFVTQFYRNDLGYGRYSTTYTVGIECSECAKAQVGPYQDTVLLEEFEKEILKRSLVFAELWNRRAMDAVEVVRCKDCKFYHTQKCKLENPYEAKEDNFCSFAERKE